MGVTQTYTGKTALPAAPDMERALLAILLSVPEGYYRISAKLKPGHFYRAEHEAIYRAISGLMDDQKGVEALTVSERMTENGDGPEDALMLLIDLAQENTRSHHIETYADKIIETWQRRELMRKCLEVARSATDPTQSVADTLSELTQSLDQVSNLDDSAVTLREQLDAFMANGKRIYEKGDGLLGPAIFGIPIIDKAMDGAHGGELCIVSGGTGEGKSSLYNTAQNVCLDLGIPVYDWSGEMDVNRRISRIIAARTGLNSRAIYKGMYYNNDKFPGAFEQVVAATDLIEQTGHVYEVGQMTLSRAITTITYHHRVNGIKIFFFDRKELFDLTGIDAKGDDAVAYFMNRLRQLAVNLDIQIFVAAQLRKSYADNPGGKPTKADILGTGATMQASTQIIIAYRPELYRIFEDENGQSLRGKSQLLLIKNTNGELAEATTNFTPELALFSDEKPEVNNGQQQPTQPQPYGAPAQMQAANKMNTDEDIPF